MFETMTLDPVEEEDGNGEEEIHVTGTISSDPVVDDTGTPDTGTTESEDADQIGLSVKYGVTALPANGKYFVEGETITYFGSVANESNAAAKDISIFRNGTLLEVAGELTYNPDMFTGKFYDSFEHTVTAEDVAKGYAADVLSASWYNPYDDEVHSASKTAYALCGDGVNTPIEDNTEDGKTYVLPTLKVWQGEFDTEYQFYWVRFSLTGLGDVYAYYIQFYDTNGTLISYMFMAEMNDAYIANNDPATSALGVKVTEEEEQLGYKDLNIVMIYFDEEYTIIGNTETTLAIYFDGYED